MMFRISVDSSGTCAALVNVPHVGWLGCANAGIAITVTQSSASMVIEIFLFILFMTPLYCKLRYTISGY